MNDTLPMQSSNPSTEMFDVLDETEADLIAIRVGRGTKQGYHELYSLLVERSEEYGSIRVYEEVPDWNFRTYLSHLHGLIPDLQYGPDFNIRQYAAIGDSVWAKLLYYQWRCIRPIWPVAPDDMRYFQVENRSEAFDWLTHAPH